MTEQPYVCKTCSKEFTAADLLKLVRIGGLYITAYREGQIVHLVRRKAVRSKKELNSEGKQ